MLDLTLRILGVTVIDLHVSTDDPDDDEGTTDLDGRTVGFEARSHIIPSMEEDE